MAEGDPFTYADDREVYVSSIVVGGVLGWGTWVYPDSSAEQTGLTNPRFYFGSCAEPCVGVPPQSPLHDGEGWTFSITVTEVGAPDFFGFDGLDGSIEIDLLMPASSESGPTRCLFKVARGETTEMTFAVRR